jgi:hypothetical protein
MRLGRFSAGRSDGRRNYQAQLLPTLSSQPFTSAQKATLHAKAFKVQNSAPFIHPGLSLFNQPADAEPFKFTPSPFPVYPAVGAGPLTVLAFSVPRSKILIVQTLAIVNVGGNPPDGTGRVIWRVLRNGGGLRGLANLTTQIGTMAAPEEMVIVCYENDTVQVTVEQPALLLSKQVNPGQPGGNTTAAAFKGFMYPLSEAVNPQQGTY